MNISAVSSSADSANLTQVQAPKQPAKTVAQDADRDGDTDKVGQPDTNDGQQGSVGSLLNAKA